MDVEEIQWVLDRTREEIVRDLQPKYILKDLQTLGAIDAQHVKEIQAQETDEDQAQVLLDIISKKGWPALNGFLKSLRDDRKYDWLADSILDTQNTYRMKRDSYLNILIKGGVPRLPPHMLSRSDLQEEIQAHLINIFQPGRSGWVVIHGMAGSGKSLLAAASLRGMSVVQTNFVQEMFWIKIGTAISSDGLLTKMHMLCEKLDSSFRGNLPCSLEMASDRLRVLLHSEEHKNSLVILDDVWDDFVVRHFDLECKVLVTTRDRSIMSVTDNIAHYVALKSGFTLEESRQFLANSLMIPKEHLPRSVDEIWERTKGYPLVMAIISAVIRQHKNDIIKSFDMCLTKLLDTSLITVKKKSSYEYPCIAQALQMSIASLQDKQKHYCDLAIFPSDSYIHGHVLETFWEMDAFEVEDIMNNFIDKSVAIEVSNGHESNSYTIHDLYLDYLRNTQENSLMERHQRLIRNYLQKCGGRYEDLPNDSYILLYLGHHLQGGQMYDDFSDVFLSLKVLIAKLAAVGPADVLGDFFRYEKYISQNGRYSKELEDFKEFVRSAAHFLTNSRYDVIQVALCQPADSDVYCQARKLSMESVDRPYFEWCNRQRQKNSCLLSTRLQQTKVCCATYFRDGNFVVFGGEKGLLKVLNTSSGKEVLRLIGHEKTVNWVTTYKDQISGKEVVVSCASDFSVRVWNVSSKDVVIKRKVKKITSPHLIFKSHSAVVVKCCVLKTGTVASMDTSGEVKVWNSKTGIESAAWNAHAEGFNYCCCDLSTNENLLLTTAGTFIKMWNICKRLPQWEYDKRDCHFVSCCFTPDCKEVIATANFRVIVYNSKSGVPIYNLVDPNKINLLHCTVSEDGTLIAASTMGHAIVIWNRSSREVIDYIQGHNGEVNSVAFSPLSSDVDSNSNRMSNKSKFLIVSAASDGSVRFWRLASTSINEQTADELEVNLKGVFAVQFDSSNEPLIAAVNMNNRVKVYNGEQQLVVGENGSKLASFDIRCAALANNRDKVLYGCANGHLKVFDIRTNMTKLLMESKSSEVYCCAFSSDDKVIAAGYENGNIIMIRKDKIETGGHNEMVTFLKFYNGNLNLISCSFDNTMKVWNTVNGILLFVCEGHKDSVVNCDVTFDNKFIASSSTDKTLMIWNASTGSQLLHLCGNDACIRTCSFAPKGYLLASGDDAGNVKLWHLDCHLNSKSLPMDLKNSKMVTLDSALCHKLALPDNSADNSTRSWVKEIRFSPDGSQIVFTSDVIYWYSISNAKLLQTFPVRGSRMVTGIFCSKDYRTFIAIDDVGILYCLKQINSNNKERNQKLQISHLLFE